MPRWKCFIIVIIVIITVLLAFRCVILLWARIETHFKFQVRTRLMNVLTICTRWLVRVLILWFYMQYSLYLNIVVVKLNVLIVDLGTSPTNNKINRFCISFSLTIECSSYEFNYLNCSFVFVVIIIFFLNDSVEKALYIKELNAFIEFFTDSLLCPQHQHSSIFVDILKWIIKKYAVIE